MTLQKSEALTEKETAFFAASDAREEMLQAYMRYLQKQITARLDTNSLSDLELQELQNSVEGTLSAIP